MDSKTHLKEISDTEQAEILKRVGLAAGIKANRESKALGLSVTYLRGLNVVEVSPEGDSRVVATIQKTTAQNPVLKKGTVLCRK